MIQQNISQCAKQDVINNAPPQLNIFIGDFSQVPNQLLEQLMRLNLSPIEFRICLFMVRQLSGWDYEFKPIEIAMCAFEINEKDEKKIMRAFKSLVVDKKILSKKKIPGYRTPLYGFNQELFPRTVIGKPKSFYIDGSKVIDLKTFKMMKVDKDTLSSIKEKDSQDSNISTKNPPKPAPTAAPQPPKYPQIPSNTHIGPDSNKFEAMKTRILKLFPNDSNRIDKTFRQIKDRGYEKEGCAPFQPAHLEAWFEKIYPQIRREYDHHADRQRA